MLDHMWRDPLRQARNRGLRLDEPAVSASPLHAIIPGRDPLPPGLPPTGGELVVTPRHLVRVHEWGDWVWPLTTVGPAPELGPASLLVNLGGPVVVLLLANPRDLPRVQAAIRLGWEIGQSPVGAHVGR